MYKMYKLVSGRRKERYSGNYNLLPCVVGQMCFPKKWAHFNLEFSFRPDFWCAVIDCHSEPKIKMLFLHFASSKEDGLPAGVSDKVFANLQQ